VQKAYRGVQSRMKNVEVHIFPGILHGYMMRGNAKAFDQKSYEFSVTRALAVLKGLRGEGERQSLRKAV
jgi:carboxymethylenebutenolidase